MSILKAENNILLNKSSIFQTLPFDWQKILQSEFFKDYIHKLDRFVQDEYDSNVNIYPPKSLVFNAFKFCPFDKVKVLIMGQDPYHGPSQAHGLAFSVPKGLRPPPSLKNIFKELKRDINCSEPPHGCLESWARQGVMLLNATLTVREGEPLSHKGKGWEIFTNAAVAALGARREPLIFVLWGRSAIEKKPFIEASRHVIFQSAHPSPLSAHQGFIGSSVFSKINKKLVEMKKEPIVWEI